MPKLAKAGAAWILQTFNSNVMNKPALDLARPLELLTQARDEVRLNLHLLSLDARQKWHELDAQILSLENKLGQGAESLSEATASFAIGLSGSVKDFVDSHVRHGRA